jgi:hypothetical protein
MFSFRYFQSSLLLALLVVCICNAAQAGETRGASQSQIQQTVNEVSRPDTRGITPVPVRTHKRTAHWKTKYWNQKPKQKTP